MRFSRLAVLACALLGVTAVFPNLANAQSSRKASSSDDYYNLFEVGVFGGFTHYGDVDAGVGTRLSNGGVVGLRLTENIFEHFGIEESYAAYSRHDLNFLTRIGGTQPQFDTHIFQGAINAIGYFTPRERRVRPFLTIGFGVSDFSPTRDAKMLAHSYPATLGFSNLSAVTTLQTNYGAGVKWQLHRRVGLRADVRGLVGPAPRFGLPSVPTGGAYLPSGHWLQGVQTTVGMSFYFGRKETVRAAAPAPPPPPPPPPPAAHSMTGDVITASATSVCPGDRVTLSFNASDPMGHRMSYQWSVDGAPQSGSDSSYAYTAGASGDHRIELRVSDTVSENPANAMAVTPLTIHVRAYSRPTVSGVTANPTEMERGQTSAVQATASGSECSGTLSYSWSASEGAITGSGASAQFNSSTVSFNEGDRSRPQSKQVTLTATVTDSKGGSGTGSTTVTVNDSAQSKHFGDIVFPKDSSRVNNCGKRVLIEQLYPLLTANSNYDVVLVGHIDSNETTKGKKGRNLDRDRVLNTAAVLSGGSGTCTALDQTRIKGVWVGTSQDTEVLATSCAVSATAPAERRGNDVESGEGKNRRVEIWLVPKGLSLPAAAKDAKELSDSDMKRIGCPK